MSPVKEHPRTTRRERALLEEEARFSVIENPKSPASEKKSPEKDSLVVGSRPERLKKLSSEMTPYMALPANHAVFDAAPFLHGPVKTEVPSFAMLSPGRVLAPAPPLGERPYAASL